MKYYIIPVIVFCLLLISCKPGGDRHNAESASSVYTLKYAGGFSVYAHNEYRELIVWNPWNKTEVFARYYLVKDAAVQTPRNGLKIKVPVQTIAISSVTHIAFLDLLNETKKVNGACSPELIFHEGLRKAYEEGKITNLGDAFNIRVEASLKLQPDMMMVSGYNQNDPYTKRLSEAGIPVVYNNEWMESSLTGRAEWLRFVALFLDKEAMADSLFTAIEKNYNEVKNKATAVLKKPKVMSGSNFRGTWYMPGGRSFMARLFADAGAVYPYAADTTSGSIPLNVEKVIRDFADADVWLNCSYNSVSELLGADRKHALFKPLAAGAVYHFNRRMLPSGANDYWEGAVGRPDVLLKDVISILHPGLFPEYQLYYAGKVE
jgi:iron complex transport system substrate-binding protein